MQSSGAVSEILERDDRAHWVTSRPAEEQIDDVKERLKEGGVVVHSVSPASRSLEEKFLETVEEARERGETTSGAGVGGGLPEFLGSRGGNR